MGAKLEITLEMTRLKNAATKLGHLLIRDNVFLENKIPASSDIKSSLARVVQSCNLLPSISICSSLLNLLSGLSELWFSVVVENIESWTPHPEVIQVEEVCFKL